MEWNMRLLVCQLAVGVCLVGIRGTISHLLMPTDRMPDTPFPSETTNVTTLSTDSTNCTVQQTESTNGSTLPSDSTNVATSASNSTSASSSTNDATLPSDLTLGSEFQNQSTADNMFLPESRPNVAFYCSTKDEIVVMFKEYTMQPYPRVLGLMNGRFCKRWSGENVVLLTCGHRASGPSEPVTVVMEYDNRNTYSRASVVCPSRVPRQNIEISANRGNTRLGIANARMEIGLNYNNIKSSHRDDSGELQIKCQPKGNIYITHTQDDTLKHVFSFNSGGAICDAIHIRVDVIEISGCSQRQPVEIAFSSEEITDNIIGGNGMLRIYKFHCSDIRKDKNYIEKIPVIFQYGGTSGLVTWSSIIFGALVSPVMCYILS